MSPQAFFPLSFLTFGLLVLLIIVLPLVGLISLVTAQALRVTQAVTPWATTSLA